MLLSSLFSLNLPSKYLRKIISEIITKSQNNMDAKPLFLLARSVFPDKGVELKDQIKQGIKAAREIKNERLLVEMLLTSSLPADKLESKKIISQMIESYKRNQKEETLGYLTQHIFSKHAIESKEQISELIEVSQEIKLEWPLIYLALYTFPQNAIELKEQISQAIKTAEKIESHRTLADIIKKSFFKYGVELKEQISEVIKSSLEIRQEYLLWNLARSTFFRHGVELKEQISQMIQASQELYAEWPLRFLGTYTFFQNATEFKEQIFQTLVAYSKLEIHEREDGLYGLRSFYKDVLVNNKEMKELAIIVERFLNDPSEAEWSRFKAEISALNGQKNCRSYLSAPPAKVVGQ